MQSNPGVMETQACAITPFYRRMRRDVCSDCYITLSQLWALTKYNATVHVKRLDTASSTPSRMLRDEHSLGCSLFVMHVSCNWMMPFAWDAHHRSFSSSLVLVSRPLTWAQLHGTRRLNQKLCYDSHKSRWEPRAVLWMTYCIRAHYKDSSVVSKEVDRWEWICCIVYSVTV